MRQECDTIKNLNKFVQAHYDHVLTASPVHRAPNETRALTLLNEETQCLLTLLLPASNAGSAVIWSI